MQRPEETYGVQKDAAGCAQEEDYAAQEYRYELENRMKNLLWTVSGDYGLDVQLDLESFQRSKYITLYDAVKQGAFARYFSQDEFGMYLVKKLYLGADEHTLMTLAQMCVDQAVADKITAERKGVISLRRKAFEDILDRDFERLARRNNPVGRMKIAMLQEGIDGRYTAEKRVREQVDELLAMRKASDTMEVIRGVDRFYNRLVEPDFEQEHGTLEQVLSVSAEDLKKFDWQDFLDENAVEASLEQLMRQANSSVLKPEEDEEERRKRAGKILITEEAARKMHSYIEQNFGSSYMDELTRERLNRRICRGVHADCKLYFTDGILHNCVRENNTYVLARRTWEMTKRFYRQNDRVSRHNIEALGDILKRSLQARDEDERMEASCGTILPAKLWKVGRTEDAKLFQKQFKRNSSDFVVDVLIDASGSQKSRQQLVALQGYILSAALSRAGIPHRVLSFCTFWDHTVMRRFREYDEGREADWRLMEFTASSSNRDGLALRAAADGLLERPEENKVLIVLSDGRPNDLAVNRPNVRNPAVYTGEYAIKDTAGEVRRIRGQGISVLGVFAGEEQDLMAERRIFGKDFAYIRDLSGFAHVVGRYLKKQVDERE
ncbi:MAG: nitric oxide reductase activation protein [Clostridiales bacterium]|nr:nitric oxide reductase activation protein [Clostridiales bacterium]